MIQYTAREYKNSRVTGRIKNFNAENELLEFLKSNEGKSYRGEVLRPVILCKSCIHILKGSEKVYCRDCQKELKMKGKYFCTRCENILESKEEGENYCLDCYEILAQEWEDKLLDDHTRR
ncbi:hypothetical protein [Enterococcus sp. AZ126]|uniref:hypothetical protein n=1 Tax=Enterococcus sp. AZ126 TaxID=2774635 RepID=UPI003F286FE1